MSNVYRVKVLLKSHKLVLKSHKLVLKYHTLVLKCKVNILLYLCNNKQMCKLIFV